MAVDTKWDTYELTLLFRKLKDQKDIIEDNKKFLININNEAEKAWQGYAGRTFGQRLDIDVENFEIFLKDLNSLVDDMAKVIDDCYEKCETEVEGIVHSLKNSI